MRRGEKPASLYLGTAKIAMPTTLITVATPARTTGPMNWLFALQLRGPFNAHVRTGLSPYPRSLCRLIGVYSSSSQPLASQLFTESKEKKGECQ
jgi:hypothetical protein